MVITLPDVVERTLAPVGTGSKHMFEPTLDFEQVFGHHRAMSRTRVRRRRRITAAMLSVAVGVVLGAPVAGALARHPRSEDGKISPATRWEQVYVVRAGDTVWSIAEGVAAGSDPRVVVDAIAARNGIEPGAVVPGQALIIPRVA
jgi:nucleoid-associated protein YgaU